MIEAEICDIDPAYEALEPGEIRAPVVFNSPHSGRVYPPHFIDQVRLELPQLRRSEDSGVDELFQGVVERGMPLMRVHFPRSMVDVNREPYELDPRMFDGRLPTFANTRSMRVAGGLGTDPAGGGRGAGDLRSSAACRRGADAHRDALQALSPGAAAPHRRDPPGRSARSCWSTATRCPPWRRSARTGLRADIVIGDRYGTSCSPAVGDLIEGVLRARGYNVLRNKPYAGGFITEHYGQPQTGVHAVQIEINRAIYMDERTYRRTADFPRLQSDLMALAEALARLPLDRAGDWRIAAE